MVLISVKYRKSRNIFVVSVKVDLLWLWMGVRNVVQMIKLVVVLCVH